MELQKQSFIGFVLKGTLYALAFSLIFILVFAFLLRFFGFGEGAISIIVQIIKGASVFLGVFLALRKNKEMGFLIGIIIGLAFTIFSFFIFSMLDNFTFEFSRTLLNDIIFQSVIGGICGIIVVNLKK